MDKRELRRKHIEDDFDLEEYKKKTLLNCLEAYRKRWEKILDIVILLAIALLFVFGLFVYHTIFDIIQVLRHG